MINISRQLCLTKENVTPSICSTKRTYLEKKCEYNLNGSFSFYKNGFAKYIIIGIKKLPTVIQTITISAPEYFVILNIKCFKNKVA